MSGDAAFIKRRIEGIREIAIVADSVFAWDKEWYPAATSGALSLIFLFIWYQDPSMLTLMSALGLVATLVDFAVPRIQTRFFPESAWTAEKEKKLEQICQELMFVKTGLERIIETVSVYKRSSPIIYFVTVVVTLYILAYLGALFSGFFLSYLCMLTLFLIPGLHRRGFLKKYCAVLILKIGDFVKAKKLE